MALSYHHVKRLRDAAQAADEAREAKEDAIVAAYKAGGGMREIAREVGMDHVSISKMLQRLGAREPKQTAEELRRELDGHRD